MLYKAMDDRGKTTAGRIEAVNVADLELRLGRMGLDLINYREANIQQFGRRGINRNIRRSELINFCFHLEQLVSAGVPVVEGLSDLRDSVEDGRLREVIAGMIESIQGGATLSESMGLFPHVFDSVFVSLIRAGELSGQIGPVLRKMTDNLKWEDEQSAHVRKILTYPLLVGVVIVLVIGFLMVYLVPQLVQFIESMGEVLPWHTKALIAVSDVLVDYWWLFVIAPIPLFLLFVAAIRVSPSFQHAFDAFKLRIWVLGPLTKKLILARFASYFSLMYASGISVLDCIKISEGLLGNKAVESATRRASQQIADGASISAGFEYAGLFPPLVLRMLRVGETTGGLDTALENISYFYERDVRESIDRMQSMIGPILTFILGLMLLWVLLSVLGPIYDLIANIKV